MICPTCNQRAFVKDVRFTEWGRRRRYRCPEHHVFSTVEYVLPMCEAKRNDGQQCAKTAMFNSEFCVSHQEYDEWAN